MGFFRCRLIKLSRFLYFLITSSKVFRSVVKEGKGRPHLFLFLSLVLDDDVSFPLLTLRSHLHYGM